MSEPFMGLVMMSGFLFPPKNWAFCNGQKMPIAQNQALFAILGTTYGGDGVTTFALPDLRSRSPLHPGQGDGLSLYVLGQFAGAETVTLTVDQIPAHNHVAQAVIAGDQVTPAGNIWAGDSSGSMALYSNGAPDTQMNPAAIALSGGGQPHTNIQPYLAVNFIIAIQGLFPSRN
jgi:microcystin-dependent protein